MNPWLFIHSLWIRDPRDRAHLKALWARDERQRGLMRWLVLLILPALVLAGVVEHYNELVVCWVIACYALCHIWTCEDVKGAEFEAVLPARPVLRLQVLVLGAWLPMLLISVITVLMSVLRIWISEESTDHGFFKASLVESLLALSFAILILTAINWVLRHRILRLPMQLIASAASVPLIEMSSSEFFVILVGVVVLGCGLYACAKRREVPVSPTEDFSEKKSRWRLVTVIFAILTPSLLIAGSAIWLFSQVITDAIRNFKWLAWQQIFILSLPWFSLLIVLVVPFFLIRFRPFCRRYFYIAALLFVAAALLYRYYLTIMPPGGF
ncbi:MAG: hypothetical protein RL095_2661 [Verrucomicrobiota bacterium]|jgi:hypothetical protein